MGGVDVGGVDVGRVDVGGVDAAGAAGSAVARIGRLAERLRTRVDAGLGAHEGASNGASVMSDGTEPCDSWLNHGEWATIRPGTSQR